MGFLKARQTKSKVAPIGLDLDRSNMYFEFEHLATLVRDAATWLSNEQLVSSGMRGTDVLGIGSARSATSSTVVVEDESMSIGLAADTSGPLTFDWKVVVEVYEGQHEGHRRAIITTPEYLTIDGALENETAYRGLVDLLEKHIREGTEVQLDTSSGSLEVTASARALRDPVATGVLEQVRDRDVANGVSGRRVLRLPGRTPADLLGFFDRQMCYPHERVTDEGGRTFLLGSDQKDRARVDLRADGEDTVMELVVEVAPQRHPADAALAMGQARGILWATQVWGGADVVTSHGDDWLEVLS